MSIIPNDLDGPGMTGRMLMGVHIGPGVHQFSGDAATMSFPTGHDFLVEDVSSVVDLQFDATDRLLVLTTSAMYRVDPIPRE